MLGMNRLFLTHHGRLQPLHLWMVFIASGPFADDEANAHSFFMDLALVNRDL